MKKKFKRIKRPAEDRFWEKVEIKDDKFCWLWTGGKYYNGYGQFLKGPNKIGAHRFAYELTHGEISDKKMLVCHKCDVRDCVNPNHLFLGTYVDNFKDMNIKGRRVNADSRGEKNGRATINDDIVINMRKLYKELNNIAAVARKFNVSETQTARIVKNQAWKHV